MLGVPSQEHVTVEDLPVHLQISSHLPLPLPVKIIYFKMQGMSIVGVKMYIVITTLFKYCTIFCNLDDTRGDWFNLMAYL